MERLGRLFAKKNCIICKVLLPHFAKKYLINQLINLVYHIFYLYIKILKIFIEILEFFFNYLYNLFDKRLYFMYN